MVYTFSIIEANLIGNSNVTIQESTDNGMALLLNNIGNEKYVMDSLKVWSSNPDQIQQGFILVKSGADGNITNNSLTPDVDSYSFQGKIDLPTDGYELDGDSKIIYTVLPNTVLKLTVSVSDKEKVKANLSNLTILEEASGKGIILDSINRDEMIHEQENSDFYEQNINDYYDSLLESEEKQITEPGPVDETLSFSGNISQNIIQKVENKPQNVNQYNIGFVVFLAAITTVLVIAVGIDKKLLFPFKK
jgi:hypothetical protein